MNDPAGIGLVKELNASDLIGSLAAAKPNIIISK
jgi:hypothetical protein